MLAALSLLVATLIVLLGFDVPAKVFTIGALGFFIYAVIALIQWAVGKYNGKP